jgi:hypothetical protein
MVISHIDTVISHIDAVILRSFSISILSSSISILSSQGHIPYRYVILSSCGQDDQIISCHSACSHRPYCMVTPPPPPPPREAGGVGRTLEPRTAPLEGEELRPRGVQDMDVEQHVRQSQ